MIAASVQDLEMDKLPVNWFDALVLALLIFGFFRGRKHGMSREILPLFKWLTLVLVAGFFYPTVAEFLANTARLSKSQSCVFGYLLLAVAVVIVFMMFKRLLGERMGESNFFGGAEYYLGMMAGMVRLPCMLLVVLALLNAPYYTPEELQARKAYNNRWYGGGMKEYSGDYIPDLPTVQTSVFKKSFVGPYIKEYLGPILVETTPSDTKSAPAPVQKTAVVNIQK